VGGTGEGSFQDQKNYLFMRETGDKKTAFYFTKRAGGTCTEEKKHRDRRSGSDCGSPRASSSFGSKKPTTRKVYIITKGEVEDFTKSRSSEHVNIVFLGRRAGLEKKRKVLAEVISSGRKRTSEER